MSEAKYKELVDKYGEKNVRRVFNTAIYDFIIARDHIFPILSTEQDAFFTTEYMLETLDHIYNN